MIKELQVLEYKGERILFLDFSRCTSKEEFMQVIDAAKQWLQNKDPKSVLTLTDVTDARFNAEIINLMKELTLHNKPYVKAGAVVGISRPLLKLAYNAVMAFSNRTLPIFDTHDQAKEWLIKQSS
jgi:hypothetical protein